MNRIVNILIVFLLLSESAEVLSQNVHINGNTAGVANQLVRIIVYDDPFSKLEKTVATTRSDINGDFELNFEINEPRIALLGAGLKKGDFFISPASDYTFQIIPDTSQRGSVFDELPLRFNYKADDKGLSDALADFNIQYNTFLYENASRIYRRNDKKFIDEFVKTIHEQFDKFGNKFLDDYIHYSLVSLKWTAGMIKSDSLIRTYFAGKPILWNNIQYADFLSDVIKTYFITEKVFSYDELITAINEGKGVEEINKLVMRDKNIAKNPELAELISVLIVAKKYYNPDTRRDKVIQLLENFSLQSKYPRNGDVSGNYISRLTKLEYGTPAPSFELEDLHNVKHSLSDLKGKFVLLSFIKNDCPVCFDHLRLIDDLQKKFGGRLLNLTIVYGNDRSEVTNYVQSRGFDWPFLVIDENILLLEDYNIRVYPSYVLINPDNTISMATAPMPDENLDIYIQRQMNKYKKESE